MLNAGILLKNNKVFLNENFQNMLMYRYFRMAYDAGNQLAGITLGTFHLYGSFFKEN